MPEKIASDEEIRDILSDFLTPNGPYEMECEIIPTEIDGKMEKVPLRRILHPWSDKTLAILVPNHIGAAKTLAQTLEKVELPEKYSAILHKKTGSLEVIWTAFKIRDKHQSLIGREFKIWWKGVARTCRFGKSSDELLAIAACAVPHAASSSTEHRNIVSFHMFVHEDDHHNLGTPLSFWIDCNGLSGDELDEFIRAANFYMTYYDRESPRILIHENGKLNTLSERPRYAIGEFPSEISGQSIDPVVTSFWLGSFDTRDSAMKYLLHYRLIEYLALAHLNSEKETELKAILQRPHLASTTDSAVSEIASIFATAPRETDRIKQFVDQHVAPEKVWSVLEMNKAVFSKPFDFDGGYTVKALISEGTNLEGWRKSGPISIVDKLRAIRNCLAHGQDDGTRGVIHATKRNRDLLIPWVNLIETFAAESMLYAKRGYAVEDT
ncbi:hypothetical protein [Phaeobacter italicus]|uniref:hypothetical protein n=1 Tax=Phaeobacter italicus TaxID=481446 RepID=UPI001CD5C74A|nr:hypothetical protein [Phaeobacter italicus]MCA0855876.1 hypothetical protein [Phaeobacter italicus]